MDLGSDEIMDFFVSSCAISTKQRRVNNDHKYAHLEEIYSLKVTA